MRAEVARVEKAPTARLDQERVGVEGRVVGEIRGDSEQPQGKRPAVFQKPRRRHMSALAGEEQRFRQHARGGFTEVDGNARVDEGKKTGAVGVPMRDDATEQLRVISAAQPRTLWQLLLVDTVGAESAAYIQDESIACALELDRRASDLARAAVNPYSHVSGLIDIGATRIKQAWIGRAQENHRTRLDHASSSNGN